MLARTLSAIAIAIGLAALPVYAQDKPKAEPKADAKAKTDAKEIKSESEVLLENDKVRVTRSTFKPGAVSRTDRKARLNYFVTDGKLQRTNKEGKTTPYERKAGTAMWLEADSDVVKNIGNKDFVVIGVVHK
jgi:quercetin dioxygenase-like cupin family protein